MAKNYRLMLSILNEDKQYSLEQLKQEILTETDEQAVQKLFSVIGQYVIPNSHGKIANEANFFKNMNYYLTLLYKYVDIWLYKDIIRRITKKIKTEQRYSNDDYEHIIIPIKELLADLLAKVKKVELDDFDVYSNMICIKKTFDSNPPLINHHNIEGIHLLNINIARYANMIKANDVKAKEYYDMIFYILIHPLLDFTSEDLIFAREILGEIIPKTKEVESILLAIEDKKDILKEVARCMEEDTCNKSRIEIIMKVFDIETYEELFEVILRSFNDIVDEAMDRPSKEVRIKFLKIMKFLFVLKENLINIDSQCLEEFINIINEIKARIDKERLDLSTLIPKEANSLKLFSEYLVNLENMVRGIILANAGLTISDKKWDFYRLLASSEEKLEIEDTKAKSQLQSMRGKLANRYKILLDYNDISLQGVQLYDYDGRMDFTRQKVVTIDDKKTLDIDDAIYLTEDPDGYSTLYIHISDVGDVLKYRPDIECMAIRNATSKYLPDVTVNSLPDILAEDICSLVQGQFRKVYTHIFRINKNKEVESYCCTKGIIEVKRRLTYKEADNILKNGDNDQQLERMLNQLLEVALALEAKNRPLRRQQAFNGEFSGYQNTNSRLIIQETAILTNQTIASILAANDYPAMFRIHEANLRARYHWENVGHYALGLKEYTHATSPIRRGADLIVCKLTDKFIINRYPTDKDYNLCYALVREAAPILNDGGERADMFVKSYEWELWRNLRKFSK